ncbi:Hypothetical protein A7982_07945 [Minicystis rosea]|nr:Hypothetical protein A7982_07945 [Minicystis rosea]
MVLGVAADGRCASVAGKRRCAGARDVPLYGWSGRPKPKWSSRCALRGAAPDK